MICDCCVKKDTTCPIYPLDDDDVHCIEFDTQSKMLDVGTMDITDVLIVQIKNINKRLQTLEDSLDLDDIHIRPIL